MLFSIQSVLFSIDDQILGEMWCGVVSEYLG